MASSLSGDTAAAAAATATPERKTSTVTGAPAAAAAPAPAAPKAWAPLRKRLAVIRTVRIFSKDSSKDARPVGGSGKGGGGGVPLPDDGGVYCGGDDDDASEGGDGSGGGGCDRELSLTDEQAASKIGSPVLGAFGRRGQLTPRAPAGAGGRRSQDATPSEAQQEDGAGACEVPPHALFLQHRGKLPDWGVYEGADDDETELHRRSSGDLQKVKTKKKSIGDKFGFLSRRANDALSSDRSSGGSGTRALRPTAEQVQRWGASFDSLLADKYGLALFRAFLKTEYSDENIEFWIACEEYRGLIGPKKQTLKAQKIYSEFVAFQAPREVNLDSTTRLATINAMGSPDKHLFEQAQKRIQALMEKDSYQRFLRSEEYQALAKEAEPHQPASSAPGPDPEPAAAASASAAAKVQQNSQQAIPAANATG